MSCYKGWSHYNPVKILFQENSLGKLSFLIKSKRGLIITSPGSTKRGLTDRIKSLLGDFEIEVLDQVEPNPDIRKIEAYRQNYQDRNFQFIVGVGGGSVMDTAKALAYLLNVKDHNFSLQAFFTDKVLLPQVAPLEMIAVPTTAGTGSEVTPFATIWDMEIQKKYSLHKHDLFFNQALLDPELTIDLPLEITIATGLDALSHALESIWNKNANYISLSYAFTAVEMVLRNLPLLANGINKIGYRSQMLSASLLGGLAISSTRTALAHSISYPITAAVGMPHGLACSFTLPTLLDYNNQADDGRIEMLLNKLGFGSSLAMKEALLDLFKEINLKELLKGYGLNRELLIAMIPQMFTPERAENNLRNVKKDDMQSILAEAYDLIYY